MSVAAVIGVMRARGFSADDILAVVEAMVAGGDGGTRSKAAERQARYRARKAGDVTCDVTRDVTRDAEAPSRVVNTNLPSGDIIYKNLPSGGKKARSLSQADVAAGEAACEVLRHVEWPDTAAAVHASVASCLRSEGFSVEFEVWIALGDGGRGRLDLVATKAGGRCAIELDARRPRLKSIAKLRQFDGYRIVGLRGVEGLSVSGIDAIVAVPVRMATASERADKRTVNRGERLPPDWRPDREGFAFARDALGGGPKAANEEIEKFRDYWRAVPGARGVKLDWSATWRNWVRRSAERQTGPPRQFTRNNRGPSAADMLRELDDAERTHDDQPGADFSESRGNRRFGDAQGGRVVDLRPQGAGWG